jgi:hypothetical protein
MNFALSAMVQPHEGLQDGDALFIHTFSLGQLRPRLLSLPEDSQQRGYTG